MPKLLSIRNLPKAILHIDGDSFFVAVEVSKNPKLRGKPVVTGEERGIASALSYEAKALGLIRGTPIYQIRKKFPQVIVLPGDYESYEIYSQKMFDIVRRYTDTVEEYSIDECFADLTGWRKPLKMTYLQILENVKKDIRNELDISVSAGLAPNKVLAKVASNWQKPDGLTIIPGRLSHKYLQKTAIEKIWGIGPNTSEFLKKKGIKTAYDFAIKDENWVKNNLTKPFFEIWGELNCQEVYKINPIPKETYASIQKTRTFTPPSSDRSFLISALSKNLEEACAKARAYNLAAKKISFFLKTQSFSFRTSLITFDSLLNLPEMIMPAIREEFDKIYVKSELYRTTGVILQDLTDQKISQLDLFGENEKQEKFKVIHEQIDNLQAKHGNKIVHLASTNTALIRQLADKRSGTEIKNDGRDLLFL
ncbi:MAG TPA: DNA polymerase IV [Candidatus Paceibacterota bacterium]